MSSRGWIGFVLVLVGVVGAFAWWAMSFETTRSITADANTGLGPPELVIVDAGVACSFDGTAMFTDGEGHQLFFNSASPWSTAESTSPTAECDAARRERLPASAAIALIALLAGIVLLSADRARANRAAAAALESRAAAVAASASARGTAGAEGDDSAS